MRHQVLRTRFEFDERNGTLDQVVCDDVPESESLLLLLSASISLDSASASVSASASAFQPLAAADLLCSLAAHLDLDRGVVFRAALVPLQRAEAVSISATPTALSPRLYGSASTSAGGQLLVVVFHHIAVDGWSVQIFAEELTALLLEQSAEPRKNVERRQSSHPLPVQVLPVVPLEPPLLFLSFSDFLSFCSFPSLVLFPFIIIMAALLVFALSLPAVFLFCFPVAQYIDYSLWDNQQWSSPDVSAASASTSLSGPVSSASERLAAQHSSPPSSSASSLMSSTSSPSSSSSQAHVRYWLDLLHGNADAVLELPLDRPRPSSRTYAADAVSFQVPEAVARAMMTCQRRLHLTSFQMVLSVFSLLMHKLSGQEEVLLGTVSGTPSQTLPGFVFHCIHSCHSCASCVYFLASLS